MAFLLVDQHRGLDLTLPIVFHAFLVLYRAAGAICAGCPDQPISDITATANAIDLHLLDYCPTEEILPFGLADEVGDDGGRASGEEIAISQEGQVHNRMGISMKLLELGPLIGVEESISVGKLEIFTEKAGNLTLSSEGIVTQNNATASLFRLHRH